MMDHRTRSQRWADAVTEFSGSWPFIGWFSALCVGWIALNVLLAAGFDPYPFLFLNWVLTVVSTFQSPLILMSQNRQNETDRETVQEILRRIDKLQASVERVAQHAVR